MTRSIASRPPGRPSDPNKLEAITAAGWQLFLAHGVAAVSIDRIAAAAQVSKGTVYAHFADKYALFEAGVRREMARIEAAQAVLPGEDDSLEAVLVAFGNGIMGFLASPPAIDFYAALAGELRRDSELAALFYAAGPGLTRSNLAAILAGPLAAELAIADPYAAADALFGLWQGFSNLQLILGVPAEAVDMRVLRGVTLFLRLYGSGGTDLCAEQSDQ